MKLSDLLHSFPSALMVVRVAKLLKEHGREGAFQMVCHTCCIHSDFEYQSCIEALENISDHFEAEYHEDNETEILYFSDRGMMEYFQLCREYARLKKIPFEQCIYVRDAKGHAREWLYVNGCYYCTYELKLNPEEAWGCGIRFEYSTCEFWEFCPLLERMLEVLDFYKTELPKLRSEVEELKRPYALAVIPAEPVLKGVFA